VHSRHPVIDADSHKCENPLVLADYIPREFRNRFDLKRDRYGEQRFVFIDRNPQTGRADFSRAFLQPDGYGKGTYRPYHEEATIGGLFNRIRLEHMDREGIDHQVVYGSITMAFNSLVDSELAIALCRAYNTYISEDCAGYERRLHPVGVIPLQDPAEAVSELRRCVLELGMPAVSVVPNVPQPHPSAPESYPDIRLPKPLSHPDFECIWSEAERLDVAIGIHGAPGCQLAAGTADQLDTFTLVHVFANRGMVQSALAKLMFDGVLERHPGLRFGFLEAGVGWVPDFLHSLHEHWEKRIRDFDPSVEPRVWEILSETARESAARRRAGAPLRMLGQLRRIFEASDEEPATPEQKAAFLHEHPAIPRDPFEYLERGQLYFTFEPDDPAVDYLPAALGPTGRGIACLALDYGHWDCQLKGCVDSVVARESIDSGYAQQLVSSNALDLYGDRLQRRVCDARVDPPVGRPEGVIHGNV